MQQVYDVRKPSHNVGTITAKAHIERPPTEEVTAEKPERIKCTVKFTLAWMCTHGVRSTSVCSLRWSTISRNKSVHFELPTNKRPDIRNSSCTMLH